MENINIADICGLCAGCNHAINLAKNSCQNQKTTLFKEIVHNKNVNSSLKNLGISCANSLSEIDPSTMVILRAHGEPPETYEFLEENSIKYLDGTCINVKKIHNLVKSYNEQGYRVVIVGKYGKNGKPMHPEVFGTAGYCNDAIFIEDLDDTSKLNNIYNSKIFVVCQTTFNPQQFELIQNNIVDICKQNNNILLIKNTICGAQKAIQKSTLKLASESDLMIVVGGKHSSNTLELFANIKNIKPCLHIENINDVFDELKINNISLSKDTKIGITAGASTDKQELINLKNLLENYLNKN